MLYEAKTVLTGKFVVYEIILEKNTSFKINDLSLNLIKLKIEEKIKVKVSIIINYKSVTINKYIMKKRKTIMTRKEKQ